VFLQRAAETTEGAAQHATQAAYHFPVRPGRPAARPPSAWPLALAGGGPGGLAAAESALRYAVNLPECDTRAGISG
jgi:hypothetical protein